MTERNSKRPPAGDVPIIGDYSDAQNQRLRATAPRAPDPNAPSAAAACPPEPIVPPAAAPPRSGKRADDRLVLDPRDVHRYKRLASERERKGHRSRKLVRYAAIPVLLVVAGLVYWNFDALRALSIGFSLPSGSFGRDTGAGGDAEAERDRGSEPVEVQAPVVVGGDAPLDRAEAAAADGAATVAPPDAATVAQPDAAAQTPLIETTAESDPAPNGPQTEPQLSEAASPPATSPVTPPPAPPEAPVEPETFEFGTAVINVSEADPTAAVLVLRNGGRRGESSVTWWTTPGTATAGIDYADLGRAALRFPAGAQNRTIHVPLVGDRIAEGLETFQVHIAVGDGAEEVAKVEVVINDDD